MTGAKARPGRVYCQRAAAAGLGRGGQVVQNALPPRCPSAYAEKRRDEFVTAKCNATLAQIARRIGRARPLLPPARYDRLVKEGQAKRSAIAV
jgi:hypothetical protein